MKLKIWFRAHFFGWKYWRIYYPDGRQSYPLTRYEGYGIAKVYGGKFKIDYTIKY